MRTLVPLGVLACLTAAAQAQKAAPPTYSSQAPYVTIPYAEPVDFAHLSNALSLRVAVNGGPAHRFTIDTGSAGLMVPAREIPGFDGTGVPATFTYSSSGLKLDGVRMVVDVSFPDAVATDGKPVIAHMPVLAVTRRTCLGVGVNAAACNPKGLTHMLGVGFGRGAPAPGAQCGNAFVMLNAMQTGNMRRGFILSRKGVQLGLSAETVAPGFVWQALAPRANTATDGSGPEPRDYEPAPGGFTVDGTASPPGTVLLDTGLTNMMLALPGGPQNGALPPGTKVGIDLLGGQVHYDFTVGDATNPQTPRRVSWVEATHGAYVNTGLHALALYDLLYDADGGFLGLLPAVQQPVTP